jgi:hypothetical protein
MENQEQDGRTSSGGTHHILGVRGWRRRAEDREECKCLLREARTQRMDGWANGWYSVLCCYMRTCIWLDTELLHRRILPYNIQVPG